MENYNWMNGQGMPQQPNSWMGQQQGWEFRPGFPQQRMGIPPQHPHHQRQMMANMMAASKQGMVPNQPPNMQFHNNMAVHHPGKEGFLMQPGMPSHFQNMGPVLDNGVPQQKKNRKPAKSKKATTSINPPKSMNEQFIRPGFGQPGSGLEQIRPNFEQITQNLEQGRHGPGHIRPPFMTNQGPKSSMNLNVNRQIESAPPQRPIATSHPSTDSDLSNMDLARQAINNFDNDFSNCSLDSPVTSPLNAATNSLIQNIVDDAKKQQTNQLPVMGNIPSSNQSSVQKDHTVGMPSPHNLSQISSDNLHISPQLTNNSLSSVAGAHPPRQNANQAAPFTTQSDFVQQRPEASHATSIRDQMQLLANEDMVSGVGGESEKSSKPRRKRRKCCGECGPCKIKENCGECYPCKNKGQVNMKCKTRKCVMLKVKNTEAVELSTSPKQAKKRSAELNPDTLFNFLGPNIPSLDMGLESLGNLQFPGLPCIDDIIKASNGEFPLPSESVISPKEDLKHPPPVANEFKQDNIKPPVVSLPKENVDPQVSMNLVNSTKIAQEQLPSFVNHQAPANMGFPGMQYSSPPFALPIPESVVNEPPVEEKSSRPLPGLSRFSAGTFETSNFSNKYLFEEESDPSDDEDESSSGDKGLEEDSRTMECFGDLNKNGQELETVKEFLQSRLNEVNDVENKEIEGNSDSRTDEVVPTVSDRELDTVSQTDVTEPETTSSSDDIKVPEVAEDEVKGQGSDSEQSPENEVHSDSLSKSESDPETTVTCNTQSDVNEPSLQLEQQNEDSVLVNEVFEFTGNSECCDVTKKDNTLCEDVKENVQPDNMRHTDVLVNGVRIKKELLEECETKLEDAENVSLELLERLRTNTRIEIPPCNCLGENVKPDEDIEGPYYTHLGAAQSVAGIRKLLQDRTGLSGNAIRIEKAVFTGKEGKGSLGCPVAKWVIRRSGPEEKVLCIARERQGHYCETAVIIICMVAWEGVPQKTADHLYEYLISKLPTKAFETQRRCGYNEPKTCACQGWDETRRGASFSFGCAWSMYYNGCKYARSRTVRKFKLKDTSEEQRLEDKLQALATYIGPLYSKIAPDSYGNQVRFEKNGLECRLGTKPGRPFCGVTGCFDFCAHAHRDVHNMNNGCTVLLTLNKHRQFEKPDDEQLHVLPLYRISPTDEFGSHEGQNEKIKNGSLEVLDKFPTRIRVRATAVSPKKKKGKSPGKKGSPGRGKSPKFGFNSPSMLKSPGGLSTDSDGTPIKRERMEEWRRKMMSPPNQGRGMMSPRSPSMASPHSPGARARLPFDQMGHPGWANRMPAAQQLLRMANIKSPPPPPYPQRSHSNQQIPQMMPDKIRFPSPENEKTNSHSTHMQRNQPEHLSTLRHFHIGRQSPSSANGDSAVTEQPTMSNGLPSSQQSRMPINGVDRQLSINSPRMPPGLQQGRMPFNPTMDRQSPGMMPFNSMNQQSPSPREHLSPAAWPFHPGNRMYFDPRENQSNGHLAQNVERMNHPSSQSQVHNQSRMHFNPTGGGPLNQLRQQPPGQHPGRMPFQPPGSNQQGVHPVRMPLNFTGHASTSGHLPGGAPISQTTGKPHDETQQLQASGFELPFNPADRPSGHLPGGAPISERQSPVLSQERVGFNPVERQSPIGHFGGGAFNPLDRQSPIHHHQGRMSFNATRLPSHNIHPHRGVPFSSPNNSFPSPNAFTPNGSHAPKSEAKQHTGTWWRPPPPPYQKLEGLGPNCASKPAAFGSSAQQEEALKSRNLPPRREEMNQLSKLEEFVNFSTTQEMKSPVLSSGASSLSDFHSNTQVNSQPCADQFHKGSQPAEFKPNVSGISTTANYSDPAKPLPPHEFLKPAVPPRSSSADHLGKELPYQQLSDIQQQQQQQHSLMQRLQHADNVLMQRSGTSNHFLPQNIQGDTAVHSQGITEKEGTPNDPRQVYDSDPPPNDSSYEYISNNEHLFQNPKIGGVAIAVGHGSVLFECAKRELHATTALKHPNRFKPTRISLVFYQHKRMNYRYHGLFEHEKKMELLRQKRLRAQAMGEEIEEKPWKKKKKKHVDSVASLRKVPQIKFMWDAPTMRADTRTSDSVITRWMRPQPIITGPYQQWM